MTIPSSKTAAYRTAYMKQWRTDNPEKWKAGQKKSREKRSDKLATYQSVHYAINREQILERMRKQRAKPETKGRLRAAYKRWRDKKRGSIGGSHTEAEWQDLLARCGFRCLCCDKLSMRLTRDHVQPLSRGGSDNISNIQPLCGSCNDSKSTAWFDFRVLRGIKVVGTA